VILAHGPHDQLRQIPGVNELTQRFARSPNGEICARLLGVVALVNKTGDDVSVLMGGREGGREGGTEGRREEEGESLPSSEYFDKTCRTAWREGRGGGDDNFVLGH